MNKSQIYFIYYYKYFITILDGIDMVLYYQSTSQHSEYPNKMLTRIEFYATVSVYSQNFQYKNLYIEIVQNFLI